MQQPTPKFSGHTGHLYDRDHAATTHLEQYSAYKAYGGPSGFSGHGWAVVLTATGEVLYRHAWRNEALSFQADYEVRLVEERENREMDAKQAAYPTLAERLDEWDPRDGAEVYNGLGELDGGDA